MLIEPMLLHCSQCSCAALLRSSGSAYMGLGLGLPQLQLQRNSFCLAPNVLVVKSEKADFWQLLGGRGLPGGEDSLKNERQSKALLEALEEVPAAAAAAAKQEAKEGEKAAGWYGGFEKEMMGLTGGFPGGERGLKRFIVENPPPATVKKEGTTMQQLQVKPRAPLAPLLMPGMTVIVKNPSNPFYMYSGIVQRVSDGRVGVLFEGGNWDKLLTFYLQELERTPKGPPMTNPKSAILLEMPPPR